MITRIFNKRQGTFSEARRILITGASSGIGEAFAKSFAASGWQVVLVARDMKALESVRAGLDGDGHVLISADLTMTSGLETVGRFILDNKIHVMVNNAGCGQYGNFRKSVKSNQMKIMSLNCDAVVSLSHAFLQVAKKGDALINVSSVAAFLPQPTSAVYAASKAFVTSFSESLWFENRKRDVYVLALHPGITRTRFRERAGGKNDYVSSAQSPEEIVDVAMTHLALRALPSVVCGNQYRLIVLIARFFSRKMVVSFLGNTRSFEPDQEQG